MDGEDWTRSTSPLAINVALSIGAGWLTYRLVPAMSPLFIEAKMYGHDINKPGRPIMYASLWSVCRAVA